MTPEESERYRTLMVGAATIASWLSSPLRIGVAASVVGALFAVARFIVAAHGNIAAFILVGEQHSDPAQLPRGIPVRSVSGYDGQFYYRLALDPLDWSQTAFGIKLDSFGRLQRIAYSFFAWLTAGGQAAAVPVTLVAVNVAAFGAMAGVCAALAREAGRHALWGLLVAGYWGFLWTMSRDLTELMAIVFSFAALLAIRRHHPLLAAGMLSVAVLSRETAMMLVGAIFLARLLVVLGPPSTGEVRTSAAAGDHVVSSTGLSSRITARVTIDDVTWAAPLVVFLGWQLAVLARTHRLPIHASGGANLGVPFAGLISGFEHYVPRLPSTASLLWIGELAILVLMGILAAISLRNTSSLMHERIAWIGYAVLTLSLAKGIWDGDVGFRSLDEFYAFSCLLLLFSRVKLQVPSVIAAAAWVTVAVELIRFI